MNSKGLRGHEARSDLAGQIRVLPILEKVSETHAVAMNDAKATAILATIDLLNIGARTRFAIDHTRATSSRLAGRSASRELQKSLAF
jgi:hypothetical protein